MENLPPLPEGEEAAMLSWKSIVYTGDQMYDYARLYAADRGREYARREEILMNERDQARTQYDHVFEVMMSVFMLAPNGKDIHLPDGRVMRFNDPNAAETLRALGQAIWDIQEKIAAAKETRKES